MGGSVLLNMGVRALAANYIAIQTTGHNIANANTEGYSRQRVEMATAKGQFTGAGYVGRGADVQTITRSHNEFLTREAATSRALASMDSTRLEQLRQLDPIFKTGEQGLGNATSNFLNAMSDLASRPYDGASREVVLARASDLAARFAEVGERLEVLQRSVNQNLASSLQVVNSLAESLAKVNDNIASVRGLGQPANDLYDERDRLLAQLSEHVKVTTIEADDGSTSVFIAGGQRLVLGNRAEKLQLLPNRFDGARSEVGISEGAATRRLGADTFGGGRIAGLLRFQDEDLVQARSMAGQLGAAIAGAVNAQQVLGLNLQRPIGSVPSQPMFAVGPSAVQPSTLNTRDGTGALVGQVSITITDPGQLQASEYLLEADPAGSGQWQVTRLSDGTQTLVSSGDELDGMRIDVGPGIPTSSDQFLLQPVTRAAGGMQSLLTDPRDVAAASPLTAATSQSNTGTAAIGSLTMVSAPTDPQAVATVTFTSANGNYDWELRDTWNNLIGSGSGIWTAGQTLPAPPDADINGFQLALTGVPANGDVITISRTAYPEANNGNAVALAALRDKPLVGRVLQADGSLAGGVTFVESYAGALADIGVRSQSAEATSSISASLADQAEQARAGESGVNLDEEAARLLQYQQSYQAAAKVLQIAQQVFETLLQTTGG